VRYYFACGSKPVSLGPLGGTMAHIAKADYETITVDCDHCHDTNLFSRISDIGEVGPYSGRYVNCLACREPFWITMDTASPAYEQFIHDADQHFGNKRYMLAVASLTQAWEIFLSTFADSTLLFRPFFAQDPVERDVSVLNRVQLQLHHAVRRFSFYDLRNLLFNIVSSGLAPSGLDQTEALIPRIEEERWDQEPRADALNAVAGHELRDLLIALRNVTVGTLRNRVVHQHAYRPTRQEVNVCLEQEVVLLYKLEQALNVGVFEEFAAGVV
jgi:hypothetical protein